MKTDRIKQTLDKNHFTAGIRQRHELSVLRGAGDQVNNSRPPSDGGPIEHENYAGCRLAVIQLTSPVCIRKSAHHIWELTGEADAGVENTTKNRSKTMAVQKTKLFRASQVAKTLLSHNSVLSAKTVEPSRQLFDREGNVRASRDADEQQTSHQLAVGKRRRSVARFGAVMLCETNS
jgi:hypothetical protein